MSDELERAMERARVDKDYFYSEEYSELLLSHIQPRSKFGDYALDDTNRPG